MSLSITDWIQIASEAETLIKDLSSSGELAQIEAAFAAAEKELQSPAAVALLGKLKALVPAKK